MFTGKFPYHKSKLMTEKELINAYENVVTTSDELIKLQKVKIELLQTELVSQKETIQRLISLLDEAIDIAKKPKLPIITLN